MGDERQEPIAGVNPAGLVVAAAGVVASSVCFAVFADKARVPLPKPWHIWAMWLSVLGGVVLVEAGSWLNAGLYRSLEGWAGRRWVETPAGVALVLGIVLFGDGLAFYARSASPGSGSVAAMVAGVALMELALIGLHRSVVRICTSPSFPLAMIVIAAGLLGASAFALLSVLNARHFARRDLTTIGLRSLDRRTLDVLASLDKPVRIISTMVAQPNASTEFERKWNKVRKHAQDMLDEYAKQSPQVEHLPLSPYDDQDQLARLREQLKVSIGADVVLLECGGGTKLVELHQIARVARSDREASTFKGEAAFTSALLGLVEGTGTKVCFVAGHGEKPIDEWGDDGLSQLASRIRSDNCKVETASLPAIPDDCGVLVIAGPTRPFSEDGLDALRQYIHSPAPGRVDGEPQPRGLIVLLDPITGDARKSNLEGLLSELGIRADTRRTIVQEVGGPARGSRRGEQGAVLAMAVSTYQLSHPITSPMADMPTVFDVVCPIAVRPPASRAARQQPQDDPLTVALARTATRTYAMADYDGRGRIEVRVGEDPGGPFTIAAARGKWSDTPSAPAPPCRLVVFGDSDFVTNRYLKGRLADNDRIFRNALTWAAERDHDVGILPKTLFRPGRIEADKRQKDFAHWAAVIAPPFHVLLIGIVVWWIRRR